MADGIDLQEKLNMIASTLGALALELKKISRETEETKNQPTRKTKRTRSK